MPDQRVDCPACQVGDPCEVRAAAEAELAKLRTPADKRP